MQEFSALSNSILAGKAGAGTKYYGPIPGVFKCWRGDVGTSRLFGAQGNSIPKFDKRPDFEDLKPCWGGDGTVGQIHYWAHSSLKDSDSGILTALKKSFFEFADCYDGSPTCSTKLGNLAESPTAAPTAKTATLTFSLTSALTADQIRASADLMTALKVRLALTPTLALALALPLPRPLALSIALALTPTSRLPPRAPSR